MNIIEAAAYWRNTWVDEEDLLEEKDGCNCEVCKLIRACNEHLEPCANCQAPLLKHPNRMCDFFQTKGAV